jgi:hypothetical protein
MSHYKAPAFDASQDVPVLELRDGRTFRGRRLSFASARNLEKRYGEVAEARNTEALFQFAHEALTSMTFPADEVLADLTVDEVAEALALFFGFRRTSSEPETSTSSTTNTNQPGGAAETPSPLPS